MSTSKKRVILNTMSVKLGCSSCRRPKLSNVFNPKPRKQRPSSSSSYKKATNSSYFSSSYSWDNNTPTTFSSILDDPTHANYSSSESDSSMARNSRAVQGFGKMDNQSVAVEKDSEDPYLDFRQSMLQMIIERQISTKHDLKELLNCFLQLNSPYYHGVIVRAFMEICNGQYPAVAAAAPRPASPLLHGGRWSSGY
ncbi:hypothetical protein Leryth_010373 [Lithospermum erythrorhizon]|uniref:Transcription repressor n=1 Tax=Lithospermum erythrorhizon TaxID=34254 RepID=A0AAV3QER7_LITER|nr:hypothetical protein Leryth_010373 [Lithospermum erythrorhizon]